MKDFMYNKDCVDNWNWVRNRVKTLYGVGLITEDILNEVYDAIDKKIVELGVNVQENDAL